MKKHKNGSEDYLCEACKIKQEEDIKQLADILFEVFMWKLEGKTEEPKAERHKKSKPDPDKFCY